MIAGVWHVLSFLASIALAICGVALSAFFSGMELGIYELNKIRLDLRAERGSTPARVLRRMIANPNNMLAVLLTGTNLATYGVTFLVSVMFVRGGCGDQAAQWYTLALVTPILFVFGESVPKNVFQGLAETLVYRLARVLWATNVAFNACGLVPLVRGVSALLMRLAGANHRDRAPLAHGVATLVAEGRASGLLTLSQSVMADRVMRIADVTLAEVMIPTRNMIWAPVAADAKQLAAIMRDHDYSRLPLLDEAGHVVGAVDTYDVLSADDAQPPEPGMIPIVLPRNLAVTDALYRMQRANVELAAVAAHDGAHVGIVTIKDLVEEIVGEIHEW